MEAFSIGSLVFLFFAIIGLILFVLGLVFLIKNIKWKKEKDKQGIKSTSNIIGIIGFSIMLFFGLVWFICFGVAGLVFWIIGGTF